MNTHKQIRHEVMAVLTELGLPKQTTKDLHGSLKYYTYVDDVEELVPGAYLRWIQLNDFQLKQGAIFVELKEDNKVCLKNFYQTYFQIDANECLLFQKLSAQELVILSAMDHIHK